MIDELLLSLATALPEAPLRTVLRRSLFALLLVAFIPSQAFAASLSLVPTSPTNGVSPGEFVTFDVIMDFSTDDNGLGADYTLGGGFDIRFDDSHLMFVSLINAHIGDPAFERDPDVQAGGLESWGFGDFNGLIGPTLVGSVVFEVLPNGPPMSSVSTQATSGIAGPFVSDVDFTTQLNVDFDSVEVIDAPEPGMIPGLMAGLTGLAALGRRGRRRARGASDRAGPSSRSALRRAISRGSIRSATSLAALFATICLSSGSASAIDTDGDGHEDFADNCSLIANANQRDTDQDGFGNLCDADLDNNGTINAIDLGILKIAFYGSPGSANWNPNADFDGDDRTNAIDLGILKAAFFGTSGPSGMACAGSTPCPMQPFELAWPLPGVDADDWVINNYVDLDSSGGVLDYQGGAKSYDGHRGVDIDSPTFREMDANFPVLAAAEGVVLEIDDSNFDRNTTCAGDWNFVTVGHPNGYTTTYGHLKQNSIVVSVGSIVGPGTQLGVIGSSGCSTAPHLHFETHDENGAVVSPFAQGLWTSPPVYATPIGFMDATLYNQPITSVDMIKDPPPNVTLVAPGTTFGIGLSMAGGESGDSVNLRIRPPGGPIVAQTTINWPGVLRHSYWWWNYDFSTSASGPHILEILVNGRLAETYAFSVEEILGGFYQVRHGVPIGDYQALFNQLVANGFRPVWLDGYRSGGQTYINVIFDKSPVASWTSAHGQNGAAFQAFFNAQTAAGRRLVHVDSYRQGNEIVYASIFVEQAGPLWIAYNGLTASQHQSQFNTLTGQGYRASVISVVEDATGVARYTALYDQSAVGGWVAVANMTSAQYNAEFANQANAGRTLAYLNGYTIGGSPRFTAIWDSLVPSAWVGVHDRTSAQFQNEFDNWTSQGLITRIVTGYDNGGVQNFGGLWTD